jgi:DNA repair exonuclease SbcCD nuclease subunit
MKLVHTADWHLSAQRNRIDADTGLNSRLIDFYRCARFTIEDGLNRGAQVVLLAGDAFHSCRPTPSEVRLLREALRPALVALSCRALEGNEAAALRVGAAVEAYGVG